MPPSRVCLYEKLTCFVMFFLRPRFPTSNRHSSHGLAFSTLPKMYLFVLIFYGGIFHSFSTLSSLYWERFSSAQTLRWYFGSRVEPSVRGFFSATTTTTTRSQGRYLCFLLCPNQLLHNSQKMQLNFSYFLVLTTTCFATKEGGVMRWVVWNLYQNNL